jgi:hypothetical protein
MNNRLSSTSNIFELDERTHASAQDPAGTVTRIDDVTPDPFISLPLKFFRSWLLPEV